MEKGQGAIEYLLIIAAAILVVAIVILAVTGALGGGQDQAGTAQQAVFDATLLMKMNSPLATTANLTILTNNTTDPTYNTITTYLNGNIYTSTNTR